VKLLEEQKKIGVEIPKIDGTPRDAAGDLPRDVSVKLGQLPTAEGELITKADEIGKKLKQLDSVVFDWANKDVLKAMGDVKDNLAKPETGKPTQIAEKHAEDQIQAMIDSLVQKFKDKRFDERNNGGGGGGGSPKAKLPSEAELRLLKKNQVTVREGTEEANKPAQKDKEQLLSLGTRQGELRDLLDRLIQKATEGKNKLGPEPDANSQLPEEASKEDIENQEIENGLLNDKVTDDMAEKGLKLTGDRMSRSRQRLVKDDPGKVTQEIQKRIEIDIDELIKMAQSQQANAKSKPGNKPGQKNGPPQPQPGGQQGVAQGKQPGQKTGGQTAADKSTLAQGGDPNVDANGNVKVKVEEWGTVTARERQAVQEGAHETVIGKYKGLVDDYYRSLAEQATKR
jgi:hypothetical protein